MSHLRDIETCVRCGKRFMVGDPDDRESCGGMPVEVTVGRGMGPFKHIREWTCQACIDRFMEIFRKIEDE